MGNESGALSGDGPGTESTTPRTDAIQDAYNLRQLARTLERELAHWSNRQTVAQQQQVESDARRYRWLRDRPSYIGWDWWNPPVPTEQVISPEFMDEAIDRALFAELGQSPDNVEPK